MRRPRLLALVAGTALLAGCGLEKPTPLVTVVSGGSSDHTEASVFCFEGQDPEADECSRLEHELSIIEATPGDRIGVDVGKELAETGWQVQIAPEGGGSGQEQRSTGLIEDNHYFSFIADFAPRNEPLRLTVRMVEDPETDAPLGVWEFLVVPRT